MNMKKMVTGIGAIVLVAGALLAAPMYLEKVDAGEYKIVQQLDGDIVVLDNPGWQVTGIVSNITTYEEAGIFYFSNSDRDGGSGEESQPITVIFKDGAIGQVAGNFQFKLPSDAETRKTLHRLYGRRYEAVVDNLIRKSIREAVISSATYFKGEEAYSYGKSAFIALMNQQIEEGILATVSERVVTKDAEGNEFIENIVKVKTDKKGNDIVNKISKLKEFKVINIGLTIDSTVLDETTMGYILKKKNAAFMKIQKMAEAEQSKQEAITAKEKGKADVARAKAESDVTKQRAVTEAEQRKEVAELNAAEILAVATSGRQTAEQDALAMIVAKKAEAQANALLVKAGLTPREKAEFDVRKAVGVARELAKANVPNIVVSGGNGSSNGANPMDAIGINMLLDISKKIEGSK